MGRRAYRRMWHTVVALVPLPLIGVAYVAATESPLPVEVEIFLVAPGTVSTAVRTADASAPSEISNEALKLFGAGGKGPRADRYTAIDSGKQMIAANLAGSPSLGSPSLGDTNLGKDSAAVRRDAKGDRLSFTTTVVALVIPERRSPESSLFLHASYSSPFSADFEVDAFRPNPQDIAYRPAEEGLNFRYQGETQAEFEDRERRCLATAIYFEARGEPERGQIAVAQVVLNRVRSPRFPQTICGVVYQGQMRKGCQFSFTCDGQSDNPRNKTQWSRAQDLSKRIMSGELWLPEVGYSTFYHANYVKPRWARSMNKIDKIGRHIFYKKRNEKPYVVEASAEPEVEPETDKDTGYLLPTLSLASAVNSVSNSVSGPADAVAGSSAPVPTQAMSLGYAASE